MSRLLLDQGLPRSLVSELAKQNIDSVHVGTLGMAAASDAEIIQKALELNAIVATLDSDFHAILASTDSALPSVIRIRIEGLKSPELAILIKKTVQLAKKELQEGAAISVNDNGIRVHRLPFSGVRS